MEEKSQIGCGCLGSVVILIVVYLIGGSWRTEVNYIPTETANVSDSVAFEENLKARHWLGGMVKGQQPDLQQVLNKYLGEGKRLTSLTIRTKHTFVDHLLLGITLGIYSPLTVTVRGTVGKVIEPAERPKPGTKRSVKSPKK